MKKTTIYIIAIGLLAFYSCKKNHEVKNTNTGAVYNVKFNVADFTQSTGPFKTNAVKTESVSGHDSLVKYVSVFYFLIYDSSGKRITTIKQAASQADFGTFTAQLKSGSYTVDIAAGGDNFALLTNANPTLTTDAFSYTKKSGPSTVNDYTRDTYFKQLAVTVSTTDQSYNTTLDRAVGLLQVNIEDPVPAGAHILKMTILNNSQLSAMGIPSVLNQYSFNDQLEIYEDPSVYDLVPGSTNNKVKAILFASTTVNQASINLQVTDIDWDADSTPFRVFANKTITVNILPNKTNLVTGNLFGVSSTGNGFKVSYDTTWNATPLHYGF